MSVRGRRSIHCCLVLAFGVIVWAPIAAAGPEPEVAGMITEIHVGRGRVEVVAAGGERRRPATPLLTLRDGEAVATTGNAWVVVVLTGGRGMVRVDESTSPFVVTARPAGQGRLHKGLMILEASFEFLSTTSKDPQLGNLGSRGGVRPPIVLTPRNGRVLPDSVSFEWRGSRSSRYGIRIVAAEGVLLERADVAATRFDYPKDAAPLRPGVRYTFQLLPAWHPPQEVWFEVVEPERARAIRQELQELDATVAGDPTAPTAVILRAAFLARRGLLHDARLQVADALTRRPEEPTLHFLLGELSARQGLPQEAMEAFAESRFLLSGPAAR